MSLPLLFLLLFLLPFPSLSSPSPPQLLDQLIVNSTTLHHHKTAVLYPIPLPYNLSSISAHFIRFRSGSLRRRGASIKEFTLPPGLVVRPHNKHLLLIYQNLGNLSSLFYNISGYKLVSPVLGLLVYPRHIHVVVVEKEPIIVDFSMLVKETKGLLHLCVGFGVDGRSVRVWNESKGHVCVAWGLGHFGVVVVEEEEGRKHGRGTWKVVVVGVVGVGFVVVMVGLVVVAVGEERRRRRRGKEEVEERRREYEEEAMRVSMVGHVRAPVAGVTRTAPAIENDEYYGAHSL